MKKLPDHAEQIIATHAAFICQVVECGLNRERQQEFEGLLRIAESNGWQRLVAAIRRLFAGNANLAALHGLDEEDRIIAESILRGIQNPASLPNPRSQPDPELAAPGLAGMILAAGRGNAQALALISNMAEQMSRVGGPMAQLAAVIRPLINGERDPAVLCRGANARTEQLIVGILAELKQAELH